MSNTELLPGLHASALVADSRESVTAVDTLPSSLDTSHLITEDDTPVDSMLAEKLQRLLTEPLYSSWAGPGPGRPFLVTANVGLFLVPRNPAIVPDVMLSIDVSAPEDRNAIRSYFVWHFGKVPDVVIEIVSKTRGGEKTTKRRTYARAGIPYYIVYDPLQYLRGDVLEIYELRTRRYLRRRDAWLPLVQLGVTLWEGVFEGWQGTWLRWCDQAGAVIPTGAELAAAERQRAVQERRRVETERQRAETEHQRAERLAARLRALGLDPEQL